LLEFGRPIGANVFVPLNLHVPLIPIGMLFLEFFFGYDNNHSQLPLGAVKEVIFFLNVILDIDYFLVLPKMKVCK
jgi:hypothetical protein